MDNYGSIGLNNRLQANTSPIANYSRIPGYDFENQYEMKGRKLIASKLNVSSIVWNSQTGEATGDFTISSTLIVTSYLGNNNPKQNEPILGIPYLTIYEGTSDLGTNQIYPITSTAVGLTKYHCQFDHDLKRNDGVLSSYAGLVTNTVGTASTTIYARVRWMYLDFVSQDGGALHAWN